MVAERGEERGGQPRQFDNRLHAGSNTNATHGVGTSHCKPPYRIGVFNKRTSSKKFLTRPGFPDGEVCPSSTRLPRMACRSKAHPTWLHQVQQTCEAYDLLHPSSTHPTDEMKESREKAIALAMAQAAQPWPCPPWMNTPHRSGARHA